MIVVDASAIGTFLIPDEAGPFAEFAKATCAAERLCAPAHMPVELASLIRKAQRHDRLNDEETRAAAQVSDIIAATLIIEPLPPVTSLVAASHTFGLTVYDAAYYLLAKRLGVPLLTDDKTLRRVAAEQGVVVLMP